MVDADRATAGDARAAVAVVATAGDVRDTVVVDVLPAAGADSSSRGGI